jgi:RNA polymerase sigma-70 factor (ECF subfamily)
MWSDNDLWEKIKSNDKKSLELLFNRYYNSLCLYSFNLVNNEETGEEIVNEVFLKIWMKRHHIRINYGIKPYLFRCVFNACVDYLEQNQVSRKQFVEIDDRINEIVGYNEDTIFDYFYTEQIEKDVSEAISRLPEQCRKIFCLNRFELLTYSEIAERLNISVNTVKTQISRAMESLREQLGKYL